MLWFSCCFYLLYHLFYIWEMAVVIAIYGKIFLSIRLIHKPQWMISLLYSLLLEVFKLLVCDESKSFLLVPSYCHLHALYHRTKCQCHWKYRSHSLYGYLIAFIFQDELLFLYILKVKFGNCVLKCIIYLKL